MLGLTVPHPLFRKCGLLPRVRLQPWIPQVSLSHKSLVQWWPCSVCTAELRTRPLLNIATATSRTHIRVYVTCTKNDNMLSPRCQNRFSTMQWTIYVAAGLPSNNLFLPLKHCRIVSTLSHVPSSVYSSGCVL